MFKEAIICFLIAAGFAFMEFLFPHSGFKYVTVILLLFEGILFLYSAVALLEIIWSPQWDFHRHKMHERMSRKKLTLRLKNPPR